MSGNNIHPFNPDSPPAPSITALYCVAIADHLALSDEDLQTIKHLALNPPPNPTAHSEAIPLLLTQIHQAVLTVGTRYTPLGRPTPEALEDLKSFPSQITTALKAIGPLIQPLPWPQE